MFGKNYACLLAICVVLAPIYSAAQRQQSIRRSSISLPSASDPVEERSLFIPPTLIRPAPEFRLYRPGPIALPEMIRSAGLIFAGTVIRIERRPGTSAHSVETVTITFRVENAIRGATPGEGLTISQWIGLWSSGQRYRLGEHVLLFLYPPSKLGLTSSVAGLLGRFQVDAWGRILPSPQQLSALQKDPVLGGKSRIRFGDFALAVRRANEEE
ncbi:MAG TPA: hypothetical protein VMB66_10800 [Candidatus Acidoferrales bacterium]|nr:hypothetical protein [Candidatus Acidoferrales bacterium]